jgi:hypothetical protein
MVSLSRDGKIADSVARKCDRLSDGLKVEKLGVYKVRAQSSAQSAPNSSRVACTLPLSMSYLPKAASSRCASLTPDFCNCSRMIGVFART